MRQSISKCMALWIPRKQCQQNFSRLCKQNSIHECRECSPNFLLLHRNTLSHVRNLIYPHSAIFFHGPHFIAKFPLSGAIKIWLSSRWKSVDDGKSAAYHTLDGLSKEAPRILSIERVILCISNVASIVRARSKIGYIDIQINGEKMKIYYTENSKISLPFFM